MSENRKENKMEMLTWVTAAWHCAAGLAQWPNRPAQPTGQCQSSSPPRQEDRDVCPRRARTRPATSWSPACFPRHVDAADRCAGAVWIEPSPSFTPSPSLPLSLPTARTRPLPPLAVVVATAAASPLRQVQQLRHIALVLSAKLRDAGSPGEPPSSPSSPPAAGDRLRRSAISSASPATPSNPASPL